MSSNIFTLILAVIFLVEGVVYIVNRNKPDKSLSEKYTEESIKKYKPIMGVLFILLGIIEAVFAGVSMGVINIGFMNEDNEFIIKIVPIIVIAVACVIASVATLKKKDGDSKTKKKKIEDEEDA